MADTRTALLLPGGGYPSHGPLLYFLQAALRRRGITVRSLDWSPPEQIRRDDWPAAAEWVAEQVGPQLAAAGRIDLVVGKSLGSFAAPLVAGAGLPAVWFTPVLVAEAVTDGLAAATAPALLIGGTADPYWDGDRARSLSRHVHEVPGADHSLMLPGLADSARLLGEVTIVADEFVARML
ncbi:alpha/beta hydrolase [Natronosporangium hydrolyticum]|uniref:Alpha/beta hydrolase n=1 Tax=Natronosporangium hydrolyticum TaxID=2811111 RepID=A0A895YGL5_9ACTN|nr:alpha/beta hydrolase [Natronosporangium hydrolyticum]QSB13320.1 alpha/beta hydrolase [Natronosporangium hydrolyticum]